jgi:RNA polymerase sigma factor (sigma-70 family)
MRIALKGRDNDARNCWRILESIGNLLQKMERLQPPAAFSHRESVRVPEARAMPIREKGGGVRNLRMLFNVGTVGSLSDGQLLERFATGVGEARELAFAALVERHGPLVYRVCRAVLGDEHEADDAFQATFLALAHKAEALWSRDALGPWLHQAAYRAACHDRSSRMRHRAHERAAAASRPERVEPGDQNDGLERLIHEEIERLPDRYRCVPRIADQIRPESSP